jgi:hypothetical protein
MARNANAFPRTSLTGAGTTGVKLKLSTPLPYSKKQYEEVEEEEEQQ